MPAPNERVACGVLRGVIQRISELAGMADLAPCGIELVEILFDVRRSSHLANRCNCLASDISFKEVRAAGQARARQRHAQNNPDESRQNASICDHHRPITGGGFVLHHLMWLHCHADTTGSPKDERRGHVG